MKAVMYHYVRPNIDHPPNYYYLDLADFRRQLDYFISEFGIIDKPTFMQVVRGDVDPPEEGLVLTFDDGLYDHYDYVYPELVDRDLWGIFYVQTGPLIGEGLLPVHTVHCLLGRHGGEDVLDAVTRTVTDEVVPNQKVEDYRTYTYADQDNEPATTKVKRILNFYVADDFRSEVLAGIEEKLPGSLPDSSEFYVNTDQLREMAAEGMTIGSHTVSHPVLANLTPANQRDEIVSSFKFLEDALDGLDVRTFCYPYGGSYSYTSDTISILEELDCLFSFDVESADITASDVENRLQHLPRYDCNEFPFGEASGSV